MLLLAALAIVVGTVCGATLGYELTTPEAQRNSWRHWAAFAAAAIVVALCALAAQAVEASAPLGAGVKALCIALLAAAFALVLWQLLRRRRQPP